MSNSSKTSPALACAEFTDSTSWRPLRIYGYYRLIVCSVLLILFYSGSKISLLGSFNPSLYLNTLHIYLILNVLAIFLSHQKTLEFKRQAFLEVLMDLFCLTLCLHASGGITSSLSILLVVSVVAGSILIVGRLSTFLAATASIAVLFEEFYFSLYLPGESPFQTTQAGTLGIAFFAAAFLSNGLSTRLKASQILASQSQSELNELQQLNHQIIQRMRTGIIALDDNGIIKLINESAIQLLDSPKDAEKRSLTEISGQLMSSLNAWLNDPNLRTAPFRTTPGGPEIIANFTPWGEGQHAETLIFIEDKTQMAQQAQHMKLASLGTLTAGIAHEIRNPLGAISHAAQLLEESPDLIEADIRLAEIIQHHSVRMNEIIENVLRLSRRSPSQFSLYNLQEWLEKFLLDFAETQEFEIDVRLKVFPQSAKIRVDSSQLTQVLTNLCQNGLRYSKQKTGQSILYLYGQVTEEGLPVLDIVDQGKGITLEQAEHIFEPFYTTEASGTGLGLYIARELCEANQARLDALPAEEGGCCMRITFAHPGRIAQ
ncbi:MAG: PAS domain-containing sensor histidine kinase [Gammaproteobacteria bacterium]|nr:MAG: PAS domain-containing sensor histidine kinase [Gammaproteobacteria bacterium]